MKIQNYLLQSQKILITYQSKEMTLISLFVNNTFALYNTMTQRNS